MFRSLKFYVGQVIDIETLREQLVAFQYQYARFVSREGDFCQRGEILDIFPTNFDSPVRIALDEDKIRSIASFNIRSGKSIWQHNLVIILPLTPKGQRKAGPFQVETPLNHFVDIRKGDYVVHTTHGIGKYLGVTPLTVRNEKKDHFVIEYQGGDKLFVPKHDMHLVQKYVGFSKRPPRLYKLGSREWKRVRAQIQKKIQRMAAELLHLQALRSTRKGYPCPQDSEWQADFEKGFPFRETPDQITATEHVKDDMESSYPMDRLLCGDVGFGKTEVAMRAAFKAVMENKQVALLVPTTILAEQHFYNFSMRMKDFPVEIAMLSRFRTKHEQAEIIEKLREGALDIVIGTHRLLSNDIGFKDLGLIIIDEEQRFGVRAKEKLKHLKLLCDVLMMTATPIPRTLYMSLSGAKDMSVISTPPQNRVPVATHVKAFDEKLIQSALKKEMKRKGQVFFLHNRVEDISSISDIIRKLVPRARIATAHGQMPSRHLEKIMLQFLKGEIDILVCTSIIESGIDIPNANTLIINRADRFGLAELHQLRGRVGRRANQAFAYFLVPPHTQLPKVAESRLKALEKHSELGAGFQIAFEDLQIRGAGNLLGEEQSGYISAIGFDLYCRLLKESVEYLKKGED